MIGRATSLLNVSGRLSAGGSSACDWKVTCHFAHECWTLTRSTTVNDPVNSVIKAYRGPGQHRYLGVIQTLLLYVCV